MRPKNALVAYLDDMFAGGGTLPYNPLTGRRRSEGKTSV